MPLEWMKLVIDKSLWSDDWDNQINTIHQGLLNARAEPDKYPIRFEPYIRLKGGMVEELPIAILCQHCNKEFRLFIDDGAGNEVLVWNWCPHCKKRNNVWARFITDEQKKTIPLGIKADGTPVTPGEPSQTEGEP